MSFRPSLRSGLAGAIALGAVLIASSALAQSSPTSMPSPVVLDQPSGLAAVRAAFETLTPAGLAPEEYFCRFVLKAPPESFIGFAVDAPVAKYLSRHPWFTNVDDLAQGKSVGIHWTSGNLNPPWFNGSTWIPPATDNGAYWRSRIIGFLRESVSAIA